jgi:hypothetical protein
MTNEHEIVLGNVLKAQVEITNNLVPITGASPTLVLRNGINYWDGIFSNNLNYNRY